MAEAALTRHIASETPRVMVVDGSKVVRRLIAMANEAGGPDNIALALADITEAA